MPHPLDEVQNTPWGINTDDRLDMLEHRVTELDMHVSGVRHDLRRNNEQTDSIKEDTKWLVNVYKGSKALGPFLVGLSMILAGLSAAGAWIWAMLHGAKP
jgi:hypothetical protein